MTGPEHYKQAEKILAGLEMLRDELSARPLAAADANAGIAIISGLITEAQVHATLALAAAAGAS